MTLKTFLTNCRITERCALNMAKKGMFGFRKVKGRWESVCPPFEHPALKPTEIAELVGKSGRFVERLCESGVLNAKKIGRVWRIDFHSGTKFVIARMIQAGQWFRPIRRS